MMSSRIGLWHGVPKMCRTFLRKVCKSFVREWRDPRVRSFVQEKADAQPLLAARRLKL